MLMTFYYIYIIKDLIINQLFTSKTINFLLKISRMISYPNSSFIFLLTKDVIINTLPKIVQKNIYKLIKLIEYFFLYIHVYIPSQVTLNDKIVFSPHCSERHLLCVFSSFSDIFLPFYNQLPIEEPSFIFYILFVPACTTRLIIK